MQQKTDKKQTSRVHKAIRDSFPINGTDYIELIVSNAKQSAYYFKSAFGFQSLAYSGLETGNKTKTSYVVKQGKILLVLTSSMQNNDQLSKHLLKHGDGVRTIALWVDNARQSWETAIYRGAQSFFEPKKEKDEHGEVVRSAIYTYGDTIHVFVERKNYHGVFLPGYQAWDSKYSPSSVGLKYADHIVGNVGWNEMNQWVNFYKNIMGFTQLVSFDDKDISTNYTALMSKVMANGNGRIKFPINEPAEGIKKSQVEEYLDFYNGPGVQHIAVATDNIIETVTALRSRGVEFLHIPSEYYDHVLDRVGTIDEELKPLKELGILIDRDDEGYLLQIFTKPVVDRPTVFFEIIQRKGAKSFGKGNFKALFEAIELEQSKRGTL